jgi:hypothetical protein
MEELLLSEVKRIKKKQMTYPHEHKAQIIPVAWAKVQVGVWACGRGGGRGGGAGGRVGSGACEQNTTRMKRKRKKERKRKEKKIQV